ncbi:peptidase M75, partial [Psychrobacter sp. 16-Bac2893]
MKINHALAMALSALSAGILISCVKPADDNKAAEVDSQVAQDSAELKTGENAAVDGNTDKNVEKIVAVDISAETEKTYLTHVANEIVIPAYADAAKQSDLLHDLAQKHCQQAPV